MFLSTLTDRGAAPALVKTVAFHEARLGVIAENIANSATPNFRAKQLDAKAFQSSLGEALARREEDPSRPLVLARSSQVNTDPWGRLKLTPTERPVENILFHDGTNLSIEREMAELAETGMVHELASTLLRGHFDRLRSAVRGSAA